MTVLSLLFYLFILCVGIQVIFYAFVFSQFSFAKTSTPTKKNIAISVLVCARNEAENLEEFIPSIIAQEYPNFELVLINDGSSDQSLDVMQNFQSKHSNIKVVDVQPNDAFLSSKKYALTLGIKSASHDFLLFTDADCKPMTANWIEQMSSHFSNTKSIVLGYGAYKKIKGSFLNLLIRFETLLTAIQYFSYLKIKQPYMAVGRNLAYRKEEFFNNNGFFSHMHVLSGDDDLFINQVANKKNTTMCFTKNSFTESLPKTTFTSWLRQKKRHVSTAKFYKPFHKFLLGIFYTSQLMFWVLSIVLLIAFIQWKAVLLFFLLRFIAMYIGLFGSAKKLNELDTLIFLPILDLFLVFTQFVIFISNLTTKKQHWR